MTFTMSLFAEVDNYSGTSLTFNASTSFVVSFDNVALYKLGQSVLQNPNFEYGNLDAWAMQQTASVPDWTSGTSSLSSNAQAGNSAGYLTTVAGTSLPGNTSTLGSLQNATAIPCVSGDVYAVSYWAKPTAMGLPAGANSYPNAYVVVSYSDGSTRQVVLNPYTFFSQNVYTHGQGSFQVPFVNGASAEFFTLYLFGEIDNFTSSPIVFSANVYFITLLDTVSVSNIGADVLQNTGFETGTLDGWTAQQIASSAVWSIGVTSDSHSGAHAGSIGTTPGQSLPPHTGTIASVMNNTVMPCTAGQQYGVSFSAKPVATGLPNSTTNTNAYVNMYVDVTYSNGTVQRLFPAANVSFPPGSYTTAQVSFQIPTVSGATAQSFQITLFAEIDNDGGSTVSFGSGENFTADFDDLVITRIS